MKLLLLLCSLAAGAHAESLPDLLFLTGMHFGGYGRLAYSPEQNRYQLVDGRINTYVVDGNAIRLMRLDEGGGIMANPQQIVSLGGRIFANSVYSVILRLDPTSGAIVDKYTYGDFVYGGSGSGAALYGSDKALLALHNSELITLDHDLKKLGVTKIPEKQAHVRFSPNFVQDGTKLYDTMLDNPATHMDCAGPCNVAITLRQTAIDFSDPKNVKVETKEAVLKTQENFVHKVVDGGGQGWFFVSVAYPSRKTEILWRSFSELAVTAETFPLPEGTQILAITKTAPLWMVTSGKGGIQLQHVERKKPVASFPLPWVKGSSLSFRLRYEAGRLYVASGHQLAIYDASGPEPKLILQQDFVSYNGSGQFQIEDLIPVMLPKAAVKTDRTRLEALLRKDYLDDKDRLALQAEVEKLDPADTWAIDPFLLLLKKRSISYQGGVAYAIAALAKFGPAAERAVPDLVYACMEGSAIRGDTMELVAQAIPKIDPTGKAVRALKLECVKKNYVCEHVIKRLLGER